MSFRRWATDLLLEEKHHKDTRRQFTKTRKPLKSTMGAYENPPLNFFARNLFPNLLAASASINDFCTKKVSTAMRETTVGEVLWPLGAANH